MSVSRAVSWSSVKCSSRQPGVPSLPHVLVSTYADLVQNLWRKRKLTDKEEAVSLNTGLGTISQVVLSLWPPLPRI